MNELEYEKLIYKIKSLNAEIKLLEEKEIQGRIDLNYRISESYKYVEKSQKEEFSKKFFPNDQVNQKENFNSDLTKKEITTETKSAKKEKRSGWQKLIFKEVSRKTHPDTLINYKQEDKDFYSDVYVKCQDYFRNKKDADLLVIANEVRVKPKIIIEDHEKVLKKADSKKSRRVNSLKTNHCVVWNDLPEDQKKLFLENYFKQLGFNISEDNLEKVIKSRRPERKAGQRPLNSLAKRRRIARAKE